MTPDEAKTILGVDSSADAKSARRSYLRLVKKHKPEQDPEGFARIREAWEILEKHLRFLSIVGEVQNEESLAREAQSKRHSSEEESQASGETEKEATLALAPERKALLEQWQRRINEKDVRTQDDWALLFDEILTQCPDKELAWELFYDDELPLAFSAPEGPEFLRAAARRGFGGFRELVFMRFPSASTEEEKRTAIEVNLPPVDLLWPLVASESWVEAQETLVQLLSFPQIDELQGNLVLSLILRLDEEGLHEEAAQLIGSLSAHLDEFRDENQLFGHRTADWIYSREYLLVRHHFSEGGQRLLGHTFRDLNWEDAADRFRSWRAHKDARLIQEQTKATLRTHSPQLATLLFDLSQREQQEVKKWRTPPSPSSETPAWRWISVIFPIIVFARHCVPGASEDELPPRPQLDAPATVDLDSNWNDERRELTYQFGVAQVKSRTRCRRMLEVIYQLERLANRNPSSRPEVSENLREFRDTFDSTCKEQ